MRRLLRTSCFAVSLFSLVVGPSCNEETNHLDRAAIIHDNSAGLVPLKIGNEWYYKYYYYDTTGTSLPGFHYDSAAVVRDTIIGQEKWYRAPNLKPADVDDLDWYTNRSDGIWVLRKVTRSNPPVDTAIPYLTFKYPTSTGEYWGSPLGDSTRVLSMDEVVVTDSGIDTCIVYEDHYEFARLGDMHYYFSPHRGWVMLEIFTQTPGGRLYVVNRLILDKATIR